MQVLTNLLRKKLYNNVFNYRISIQVTLQIPPSGYHFRSINNMKRYSNEGFIPKDSLWFSHRIVAKRRFYGSKTPRLDDIMIQVSGEEDVSFEDGYMIVWFAKSLSPFIIHTHLDDRSCDVQNRRHFPK